MKTKTTYVCEKCRTEYELERHCIYCKKSHREILEVEPIYSFEDDIGGIPELLKVRLEGGYVFGYTKSKVLFDPKK